jgi:beta-mannanase
VHGAPWSLSPLDDIEDVIGRPLDWLMWYQDWASTRALDLALIDSVRARGTTPMITWDPWDYRAGPKQPEFALSAVVQGKHDEYIRSWAHQLAAHGKPLFLRWAHEMNGDWYPWGRRYAAPEIFRDAWRHVWSIFQAAQATNVAWVWSPNIISGASSFEPWYPGDDCVDWLGLDGYNWGGRQWKSFAEIFEPSYERMTRLSEKPLMIAETACTEAGARKARWITDALNDLPSRFGRVRGLVWFDQNKERDWRVSSSPESEAAFAEAFSSRGGGSPPILRAGRTRRA